MPRPVEITGLDPAAAAARSRRIGGSTPNFSGGLLAGEQRLVLRTEAATGVPSSLGRIEEFAVLKAAFAAGVTVPEPLFACADPAVFGKPFLSCGGSAGSAAGHRITRDPALEPALPAIAERLGQELARIHTIRPPRPDLGFLPPPRRRSGAGRSPGSAPISTSTPSRVRCWNGACAGSRRICRRRCRRCCATAISAPATTCSMAPTLTGILDWEFAGWGDPDEDIGWFCCKGWRFARLDREAGGIAERAPFYRGYESASGPRHRPGAGAFLGGAGECALGGDCAAAERPPHLGRRAQTLDRRMTGRRATECELEILMLLDPGGCPANA